MGLFKRKNRDAEDVELRCPFCRELVPEEHPDRCQMCGADLAGVLVPQQQTAAPAEPADD